MSADMLSDGRLFVLEYRGDIIATGGWRWQVDVGTATTGIETDRTDQPGIFRGAYAEIAAIYVDPFIARIGLASWLIATLEAEIARLGLREVRIAAARMVRVGSVRSCYRADASRYRLHHGRGAPRRRCRFGVGIQRARQDAGSCGRLRRADGSAGGDRMALFELLA